ncbi:MAG: DUF4340 domain-containing protein [Candidatus Hydrogenedentes bacterium]|nr:DUF4340 domain-containing protein [Candidatus Hydrogenedentota bacterium]
MSPKKLIPFLVILLLLAGLVMWRKSTEKQPGTIATQVRLETLAQETLAAGDVARIEMYAGVKPDEKVVLEKFDGAWRIASHYNAPVNQEGLDKYIGELLALKGEFRASADTDEKLADFELKDDQAFHVRAFKAGQEQPVVDVLVGKAPDFRTVFVRKAGDSRVHVEGVNLKREAGIMEDGAAPKASKWLKTELLSVPKEKITRLALTYPDKELVFARHEKPKPEEAPAPEAEEGAETPPAPPAAPEYEWKLEKGGFGEKHSETELQALLGRFSALTVTDVVDPEKKADWGFDPPQYKAVLSVDGQEDVVLLGGRPTPGGNTYVSLESGADHLIYETGKFTFEQLFAKGSPLFTLPGVGLTKADATRVEVARPEGRVVVQPEEGTWKVLEPALDMEQQQFAVDNIVNTAVGLKPVDYADASADAGAFDTTITIDTGTGPRRVLLGGDAKSVDGVYAKIDDNPAVLVISRTDAAKLLVSARDLFAMSVLSKKLEGVERVETPAFTVFKDGGVWKLERDGAAVDARGDAVEDFLSEARAFQVANVLAGKPAVVEAPEFSFLCRDAGGQTVSVAVGPAAKGMHPVAVSGAASLYEASEDAVAALHAALHAMGEPPAPETEDAPAAETAAEVAPPVEAETPPVQVIDLGDVPAGS